MRLGGLTIALRSTFLCWALLDAPTLQQDLILEMLVAALSSCCNTVDLRIIRHWCWPRKFTIKLIHQGILRQRVGFSSKAFDDHRTNLTPHITGHLQSPHSILIVRRFNQHLAIPEVLALCARNLVTRTHSFWVLQRLG
eukprot:CAMPEP_0178395020 /NCGR_PEP_ID=MMETSP0689_2-20121128/13006_1 /TAXON_ID=160604 /ORGANISM="Amphidinium massartii, Strain CS-259" /LENGTH=138 /DNA_ID=CAMNT_0020015667 /DNA_START=503 /DNA_END=915 /DNA_ORIENTATION=-